VATFQDASIGVTAAIAGETAYRTYTAATRGFEFNDESIDWQKNVKQGKGLRVGGRVARTGRRQVPTAAGGGDLTMEIVNKGMGVLWNAAFGTSTAAQFTTTGAYQQTYTLGDTPPSISVMKGIPRVDQSTVDAYTFLGCMVDSFEITIPNDDIPTVKFSLDAGDLVTSFQATSPQAYASPTYATGITNFNGAQVTAQLGGTLTAPVAATPVAASSTGATAANVRNFSLSVKNNLATDRYNFTGGIAPAGAGRKSKPTVGLREITGKMTVEYDSSTWANNFVNDTSFPLLITVAGSQISASGKFEGLQIALPDVRIDSDLPNASQGGLITVDLSFTVLDNLTAAQPIYFVYTTADATL
jgi:hypothetical protein